MNRKVYKWYSRTHFRGSDFVKFIYCGNCYGVVKESLEVDNELPQTSNETSILVCERCGLNIDLGSDKGSYLDSQRLKPLEFFLPTKHIVR